jgi:outer membrane protein TolC
MGIAAVVRILLLVAVLVGLAVHAEEDSDSRTPIEVKTKRTSISARKLPHVIELTEIHSPNIEKAKGILEIARLNYEVAGRQWYPSLDFTSTAGLLGNNPVNTSLPPTPWSSSMDLKLTETFYDNGVSITNYELNKDRFERAKIEFEVARDTQLLAAANAFYDWSAALQQREILELNRQMLQREREALDIQFQRGTKTKRDVLRLESELRRNELDIIGGDNDIDLGAQKLAAAIGITREDFDREDIEGDVAKTFRHSEDDHTEIKARDHRQAKIFAYLEQEAKLATRLAQRTNWPQLTLNGGAGYHNQDYLYNSASPGWNAAQVYSWNAMVTLTYNIWDWGIRDRQVQIARIGEENTSRQDQQALFDLGNDLRNLTLQLRSLKETVKATWELLAVEQRAYNILESEYRNGHSTYLDMITNLKSLIDARTRFNASYFGYRKEQVLYSFHKGDLYQHLHQM